MVSQAIITVLICILTYSVNVIHVRLERTCWINSKIHSYSETHLHGNAACNLQEESPNESVNESSWRTELNKIC